MERAERTIMWIAALFFLIFGITQAAAAAIRGSWLYAICFVAIIAGSKMMMEALDKENGKEESHDGDEAEH